MTEIADADWVYALPFMSPDEILSQLDREVARAIADYQFISVEHEDAGQAPEPGYERVYADIPVSVAFFAQFFNSRTGYRAHYYRSAQDGEAFNARAVAIVVDHIFEHPELMCDGVTQDLLEASLRGAHTKIWFPKFVTSPDYDEVLLTLPEQIRAQRWVAYWQMRPRPRKGLLAPSPDSPGILLNGTFVRMRDGKVWNQKPDRSQDIFDRGWT